jgi:hypothetical protein
MQAINGILAEANRFLSGVAIRDPEINIIGHLAEPIVGVGPMQVHADGAIVAL